MRAEFEYLDFVNERDQISLRYEVDAKSCAILRIILQAYVNDEPIAVSNVLVLRHIASPVTLHQGIKYLINKKLIATKSDPTDGRIKFLLPTDKAIKLYRELSALVLRSQVATTV